MKKILPFKTSFPFSIFHFLLFGAFLFTGSNAFGTTKTATAGGTWLTATWSPSAPVAGDDIVIDANVTSGPAGAISFSSFVVSNGFSFTHSGNVITITGNLLVDGTYQLAANSLTVNGTTSITGTLDDNSTSGTNRFDGLITISSTGTFSNTNNPVYDFRGGITNNGSFTITGTGITTFSTSNQVIQGNTLTFGPITVGPGITLSSSGSVPVTINGAVVTTGSIDFTGAGTTTLGAFTTSGAGNITFQTLSMTGTNTISQTGTFTVLGTTTTSGTTVTSNTGLKKFNGLVTVSAGTFTVSGNAPLEFQAGMTATGVFNQSGSGAVTLTGSQTIDGASAVTFTGPVSATVNLTLSKSAGTITTNAAFSVGGNLSLSSTTTLTLAGSATTTITGTTTVTGTMTCGTSGAVTLTGAVSIAGSLNLNTSNFTSSSTTTLSGTGAITDNSNTGANIFVGLLSVGSSCSFSSGNNSTFEFRAGIANGGSFTLGGTGITTFSTSSQVIQGNILTFGPVTIASGITLSSSGSVPVTINGAVVATGTIDFTGAGTTTLGAFTTSGAGNITFQTLSMTGTNTISQTGTFTVLGTTTTTGTTISSTSGLKKFTGLVTISSGTLTVNNTAPLEFLGGITANGVFNQSGSGAVTFTGSQTIDGASAVTFTGAVGATANLLLSKSAGAVAINGNLTTTGNFELASNTTSTISGIGSIGGNFITGAGTQITVGANDFTVTGTTSLSGLVIDGAIGGVDTFTGTFSILSSGELRELTGVSNSNWIFGNTFSNAGTFNNTSTGGALTFNGDITNSGTFTRTGSTAAITFNNAINFTSNSSISITNTPAWTINGATTINFGSNNLSYGGALTVSGTGSLTVTGSGAFTVTGTTTANGPITLNSGITATLTGAVSVASGITFTNNANLTISSTAATALDGAGTFTNTANSTLDFRGSALSIATFNAHASPNIVTYGGSTQTIRVPSSTYHTLSTANAGTKSAGGNLTVSDGMNVGVGSVYQGSTFNLNTNNLTIAGVFGKSGAGSILVSGATTLSGVGIFSGMTGNPTLEFQGGITYTSSGNSATGSGAVTFTLNNQFISGGGSGNLTFGGSVTLNDGILVNSQRLVSITGNLDAALITSQWINDNGSTLNYGSATQPFNTTGTLDASANANTVNYNRGGVQTIRNTTYYHLTISISGAKSLTDGIINGDFTQTGTASLTASGTQIFATGSTANINLTANLTFSDVTISKTGSTLTVTGAGNVTMNALTVTAGTFLQGTTARTVTVNGDLSGSGTIDLSGVSAQVLDLKGANNSIGSFVNAATLSVVNYSRVGAQTVFASPNYRILQIGATGAKTLNGATSVNDTIRFLAASGTNGMQISLGTSNLTLTSNAWLVSRRSNAGASNEVFGVQRQILTDGTGLFIKEGTTTAGFTAFVKNGAGTMTGTGVYPLATTGYYSPFSITSLAATVAGTGSVSARAVAAKQPNVPYYNNASTKYWELASTNLSAISANMSFTYNNPGEVVGSQLLYEGRVWNGVTLSALTSPSAPGSIPFSTTGSSFISGSWTALDPTNRNVYYTYISGPYSAAGTWTTDPSGSTLINSAVPGSGDQIVILNGRTVTSASSQTCASLQINSGAIFDIGTSTGNNFGPVSGTGLYRQASVTLPTANFTSFVATTGGTFEYYDLPAGPTTLSSSLASYNNLLITNSTGTSYTTILDHDLTINGNLTLSSSGAGTPTLTLGGATVVARTVSLNGNTTIGSGCIWNIGSYNIIHTINIYGNVTNSGTLSFSNSGTAYLAPTTGAANVTFRGVVANTTLTSNSGATTKFHKFYVNKNLGYELFVTASAGATPLFYANGNTMDALNGTLRLGTNVVVPRMNNTGGNYDIGTSSTIPTFWIDGATVTYADGGGAIVPYGTLRISAGTLNVLTGQGSVVLRETGQFIVEGTATVNGFGFRTSNTASTHRGSFSMTGGTINLNGAAGLTDDFSVFSLPYPDNVFRMTGGVINITRSAGGGTCPNGGIQIASTSGNYDVTGGTFNVTIFPGISFDIATSTPLYNLNIYRTAGAASQFRLNGMTWFGGTYASQPLTILNDLLIDGTNAPIFNTQNNNVAVKGSFTIVNGGTYQTGTQNTTFNGTSAQTFTINGAGALSTGLSTLVLTKSSSTLTLAGTTTPVTVRAGLTINSGTLADAGKTINIAGNIINNGTHSGSGKIVLNGSTASQTISATSSANFGNLDFSNTNGASGSTQITASCHLNLSGSLGLTNDRVASIGSKQISLGASGTITGTFGANRYIKTNGLLSDGGIKKTYNSTTAFVFPFGSGTNYTPATIQFSSAPTTYGALDVRPVATKQLYVTDPNCFDLYWKVKTTGFTGIPSNSVNYTFNYGSLTDNTTYIPAFYDFIAIAYTTINDVTKVDEATNNILFTGVSYTDGDYTAGDPAAFGLVVPFYSKTTGNWNTPATWSNTSHSGANAVSIPATNSPVFVGDGSTFNHTVTVTTNGTVSGSLIVDAGSTLDCQTTTGNNFGAIPYATAGGAGTVMISSATSTAEFPAGDFGLFFQPDGGTTEYYSTGSQDFTIPTATATPTSISIDTYKWLNVNPGSGRTIAFPNKDLIIYEDLTVNGNATGIASFAPAASRLITVNDDFNISQGIFEIGSVNAQSLLVLGDATVSTNGSLQTISSGSVTHNINLEGNLSNTGTISLNNSSKSNLTFQGTTSSVFNGSNGSASVSLSTLIINKGVSNATELEVTTLGSFSSPTNNWLTLSNGMLKWSKGNTMTLTDQAVDFYIPSTAGFTLNHASAIVNVGFANSANADLVLDGKLSIQAGTLNIGNNANNHNNDLEYGSAGIPEFEVTGSGAVNINGQIRRSIVVQLGSLKYTQSGTSQVLVRGKNADAGSSLTYDRAKFEILNTGSEFNMSGSSVLTISRNGLASGVFYDIYLAPASSTITGGEIRIGNTSTPASQTFFMNTNTPLYDFSVDGTTTTKTLTLVGNPLVLRSNLKVEGNSVFNTAGLNVTVAGNFANQNTTATANLTTGGYQAINSTQVTTLNSTTANQTINGVSSNLTNFANLVINNTFSSGSVTLATNSNVRVGGDLSISSGLLNTAANIATVIGNVTNNGGHTSSGSGYLVFGGSAGQTINSSGTASFGSIRINDAAGVETSCPVSVSGDVNFQAGVFYISNYLLALGTTATVSGTFNSSSMIRINGVTSDAGVTKSYPASTLDFTFPIGTTLRYTPARINVTSNTVAGTVNLKPIAVKHPATTDPLNKELVYYWRTTATGFNGSTVVNHTYNYLAADVYGTEASYVTGRFLGSAWTPTFGIPATVDATNHRFTLTGINYFDGEYTAGESTEFNILPTYYSRNATLGGDWNDPNSWSNDALNMHAGIPDGTYPIYNPIVIAGGHTITTPGNSYFSVTALLNGSLNLGNTITHNIGTVTGTGRIIQTPTVGNAYIFPGGDFTAFTTTGGGTFEYSGSINGTLPTQATYNHIEFSGSATKSLANTNLTVNGNLTITAGDVTNPTNKNITILGDWTNSVGLAGFGSGTGEVILAGGAQSLTGATSFYNLSTSATGDKMLGSSMVVINSLTLTTGIFVTAANVLTVSAGGSTLGGSTASHVNGNLGRGISAAATTTTFSIGDGTNYTPVTIAYTGTTVAGGFITGNTTVGDHPNVYTSGVDQTKSVNRYWTLTNSGVTGFTGYDATFTFVAGDLDAGAITSSFIGSRYSASTWTQPTVGTLTSTTSQVTGISGTTFGDFQLGQPVDGYIWTGDLTTNWNTPGNWIPATVPTSADNAIIGNVTNQPNFTSGSNGQCKKLVLYAGANPTIPTGYTLTINDNIETVSNTIDGTGTLSINGAASTLASTLTVNCKLEIQATKALIMGVGSTLNIGGDLSVLGTLTHNNLPVNFTGSANSTISGTPSFYDLVVNKSSNTLNVTLGANTSVSHYLDMQSGDVELNMFVLDLGSTGSLENETVNNRVIGLTGGSIQATRTLNAPSAVNVANLGAVITSAVNLGSTLVSRRHNQVVFGYGFGTNRTYGIHPTTNTALNATLVFNYFDDELATPSGVILESELDLWRFNGLTWDLQTATLNTIANTLTKTGIPQFSDWTSGSYLNNPLAIELAYFNVNCKDNKPAASWKTLNEADSRFFVVEGSYNGLDWEEVGRVDAAGNSSQSREYNLALSKIPSYVKQLRLTMIDSYNQVWIYNSQSLNCGLSDRKLEISLYPNPNEGRFAVDFGALQDLVIDLKVLNILGQQVAGQANDLSRTSKILMDLKGLPAGLYQIQIVNSGTNEKLKTLNVIVR